MPDFHVIERQIRVHSPACNGTEIPVRNHLAHITRVTDLFKDFAEPLFITASGSGSEADQVTGNARFEKTEVIENAAVARCNGVVCFIDDNDGKLVRLKSREASAVTG